MSSRTRLVSEIRAHELGYKRAGGATGPSGSDLPSYWMSTPTSRFEDSRVNAAGYWGPVSVVIVEVISSDGTTGIGTVGAGSAGVLSLIEEHLGPLLLGSDPFEVERAWDRMYRASVRFGQRGMAVSAISGIDIALWDLKARHLGVSVVELLGGRHHDVMPAYASRLYAMRDLDILGEEARRYRDEGFRLVKQRMGFGPRDGEAGIRKNIELVRTVKEAVGDDIAVAVDAYMSWTTDYTIRMERELRELDVAWIEEPLLPRDMPGYTRLSSMLTTPIALGEHCYTKWDFSQIIDHGVAQILQPDVSRMGGITEGQKVFALAEAHELPVIPHSNESHNLHLSFSKPNAPWIEYFPYRSDDVGAVNTIFYEIQDGIPEAENGLLSLPNEIGFGVTLNGQGMRRLLRRSVTVRRDAGVYP